MGFVESCCEKGLLVSDDINLDGVDCTKLLNYVNSLSNKPFIIDQSIVNDFKNSSDFFKADLKRDVKVSVSVPPLRDKGLSRVEVVKNFEVNNNVKTMNDWFEFYLSRFNNMKKLLEHRKELRNATSIASINKMTGKNEVSTIGLVKDTRMTSNDNFMIDLEDPTGEITLFVSKNNHELIRVCENIVLDEVIGVVANTGSHFAYVDEIVFPEVPTSPPKLSPVDEYACFIADTHVGSIDFEKKMYVNFVDWLKGKTGSEEQKRVAKRVKYLFLIGDLVDGVGVYPNQDKELVIKDIYKQYDVFSDYLKDLPEDIQLIFIPGNHDALRLSEPQPPLFSDIAKSVYELSNVRNLSNPSVVNIGKFGNFQGLNVLMYHGYSYHYYANSVPKLLKVGVDKPELISEFLLKKRHLAPSHGSGLITPGSFDPYIIENVPDVIATGHFHKLGYKMYRGVNLISSSCFQKMTSYMEKLGHHPTPGFIPLLNLKTRKVKVMNFK